MNIKVLFTIFSADIFLKTYFDYQDRLYILIQ